MDLAVMSTETALLIAGAAVGLGLLGLVISILFPQEAPTAEEKLAARATTKLVAAAEPVPEDPLVANRRFFAVLTKALSVDETAPAGLAALHANLTADVFMERMQLAARSWRPDGFALGARRLALKPDGAPPDQIAAKVLEGYEQLKAGHVKESMDSFLAAIEATKTGDASDPWAHAWSAFAWRGLALIAEESGDVQATMAGVKVAFQSMVNAVQVVSQPR
ncbi:MAG: hypothetical protein HOP13_20070 [Alphaproteobacteria bacterium]|nr:hypothetical protein [Alphaproteobacteria bacterium]